MQRNSYWDTFIMRCKEGITHVCFTITTILTLYLPRITSSSIIVQTTKGKVKGERVNVHGKNVDIYWGIPFAKPPLGELRFKHPVPNDPWSGILNATEKPPACWQGIDEHNFKGVYVWNPNTNISEDCLYLNVWVPRIDSGALTKHVMIWIFGGGFYSGSSVLDIYDGRYIAAENDVIVVSMQYRLGALGYLALYHPEAPGNAGMFDQVMALDWVQQNIHYFGGNAHSVTLFGESAGAVSVGMHMMSPLSRGKFHRVILQSGAPQAAWATLSEKEAKNRSMKLAAQVNCDLKEVPDVIECLRTIDAESFYKYEWNTIDYGVVRFPFVPVVDGAFLTEDPQKSLQKGNFKRCPVLLGHNTNEANYWLLYYQEALFQIHSSPKISQNTYDLLMDDIFHYHPYYPKLLNSFGKEAIKFQYRHWLNPDDQMKNAVQIDMAVGDFSFICPCVDFAMHAASWGSSVYYYVFEHRSSVHLWPEWMGVLHADEINFVFGEPMNKTIGYTEEEVIFSKKVMKYWTNFAKTGTPNREPGGVVLDEWPLFNNISRQHLILRPELVNRLDKSIAIGQGSRARECSFWKDYLPNLVVRTADMSEMEVQWKIQFNDWSTKYIVEWKSQFDSFMLDHGLKQKQSCPST